MLQNYRHDAADAFTNCDLKIAIRWLPQHYGVQGDGAPSKGAVEGNDKSLTHDGAKVLRGRGMLV